VPHRTQRTSDQPADAPAARETAGPAVRRAEAVDDDAGRVVGGASQPDLAVEEELLVVLRGIGAAMFLTTQRIIVARDGVERRPRTGIQSFPLAAIRHLRLEMGSAPSGRIAVWTSASQEAVSMFFDTRSLDRAHELLDIARPLIAQRRRRGLGAGPVRPPSGPANTEPPDSA
jgi:hypothetical protein